MLEEALKLAQVAGPLALAAFAGVFLAGIALSFFWKSFGPWQLLKEAKAELEECRAHREREAREWTRLSAQMADQTAKYEVTLEAIRKAGLTLSLVPSTKD